VTCRSSKRQGIPPKSVNHEVKKKKNILKPTFDESEGFLEF